MYSAGTLTANADRSFLQLLQPLLHTTLIIPKKFEGDDLNGGLYLNPPEL